MTGPASAATLWTDFADSVRAFLSKRAPAGVDADDLLQEVFLHIQKNISSLREADRVNAWVFQIARNALTDSWRGQRRRDQLTDQVSRDAANAEPDEDDRVARAELSRCLAPMVARLDDPYRAAIELTEVEGLSQTDAAKRAGLSVSGMKSRVQRARTQLKAMLLDCCRITSTVAGVSWTTRGATPRHPSAATAALPSHEPIDERSAEALRRDPRLLV